MTPTPIAKLLDARWFTSVAAILLTFPYWSSGIAKLFDLNGAFAEAAHFNLNPTWLVVALTILVQIGGSALIISGRYAWLGAGALGIFTALATLIAHAFWQIEDPAERFQQQNTFFEHVGLIGGFMLAAILMQKKGK